MATLGQAQFSDWFGATAAPALRSIMWTQFRDRPPLHRRIFEMLNSTREIEQFSESSGVGRFRKIDPGKNVEFDAPVKGPLTTFNHSRWGLGVAYHVDLFEDDRWGIVTRQSLELGRSAIDSQEIEAAGIFNNGFSPTGTPLATGKALFATNHTLIKIQSSQANKFATGYDLDYVSLNLALALTETFVDNSGKPQRINMTNLLVTPYNRGMAYEITASTDRPDTANRATNVLKFYEGSPKPLIWHYLTSQKSWFLTATPSDTGLKIFERRKTYTKTYTDNDSETGKIAMRYRRSVGATHPWGIFGSQVV